MGNQKNNETIRIVRGSDRYAGAPDTDLFIQVPLNSTKKEKIEGDRNVLLNLEERFNHERQISTKFRVAGKIVNIFNNSVSGKCTTYDPFRDSLYYIDVENSITAATNFNSIIWKGYPQYDEFSFFRTSSVKNHIPFTTKSASTYNWSLYITYPSSNDYEQPMQFTNDDNNVPNNFIVSDGIPYVIKNRVVNGKRLITFYCGFKHNVNKGESIYLKNPIDGKNMFEVYSLGDQSFGNEETVLNIYDYGFTGTSFNDGTVGNFKRVINPNNSGETMSEYYVRKHKTLTEVQNVDLHRMGFEKSNFPVKKKIEYSGATPNKTQRISVKDGRDDYGFSFDRDIDIIGLIDNLDRPLTELFVTIVNKGYMGWFNNPFNPLNFSNNQSGIEVGWSFNFRKNDLDEWWKKSNQDNKDNIPYGSYTNAGKTFYYNADLPKGHELKGDLCEWNKFDQKETVLSYMSHKFSFNNNHFDDGGTVNLPFGYGYQPHYSIPIRAYSDYVETGDEDKVSDIPDYSFYSNYEGLWRWRDIYPYGYIDTSGNGVNHPFLNNEHYPFSQILFLQTPIERNNNVFNDIIYPPLIDNCE